ncbi:hypothetical protein AAG570_008766 [Ranatra chinensis]|uniref:Peptidase S1 domain-containing protein n=1 Tax=Ranatra chinensis TaxID=642074 RepID=A0ABD0ZF62_9HEMI
MFQNAIKISLLLSLFLSHVSSRRPRLAGGVEAQLGDFPYLAVSLHPEVRCTATIISSTWLLSAAHCYIVEGQKVDPGLVTIVAGVVDFEDNTSPGRQDRKVEEIITHPKFQENVLSGSDLALILVKAFAFSQFVSVVPLSGRPFLFNSAEKCMASGWGDTSSNSTNTKLLKLPVVAVQNQKVCHGLKPHQRKNMICLQDNHGAGLCDGDSGGPLVCKGEVVGVAHQVYTEVYGYKEEPDMDCGAKDIVHTYMFTCPYLNWIKMYVPEVPPKPPNCFI